MLLIDCCIITLPHQYTCARGHFRNYMREFKTYVWISMAKAC